MSEVWKPVVGHEGYYEVSSLGRVRSLPRQVRSRRAYLKPGRAKKPTPSGASGYLTLRMYKDGKATTKYVHQMVAEAFIGPRPGGFDIDHIDGDRTNNQRENLEFVTRAENLLRGRGTKYSDEKIERIREAIAAGETQRDIARRFSCSKSHVGRIATKQTRATKKGAATC